MNPFSALSAKNTKIRAVCEIDCSFIGVDVAALLKNAAKKLEEKGYDVATDADFVQAKTAKKIGEGKVVPKAARADVMAHLQAAHWVKIEVTKLEKRPHIDPFGAETGDTGKTTYVATVDVDWSIANKDPLSIPSGTSDPQRSSDEAAQKATEAALTSAPLAPKD